MKKLVTLLLAFLMLLTMLPAALAEEEVVEITMLLADTADVDYPFDMEERPVLKKINEIAKERFGITIKLETCITSEYATVVNTRLAAGADLPDSIRCQTQTPSDLINYYNQGLIYDLNDFAEYMPNYLAAIEPYPGVRAATQDDAGHLLAISQIVVNPQHVTSWLNINYQWLDKLGLAVPTTPEELKSVLKAFQENDMNENGAADEVMKLTDFGATNTAIYPYFGEGQMLGAIDSWGVDVERKITPNTKCVIPVHIQGFPCDMERLMQLKEKYGFYVVEDACQADGGSFHGKRLGTIGDCGAYSFNYFKIISAGEGGAMVTNDIDLYQRAIIYHDCGSAFWTYETPITAPLYTGTNMRVSEVTGAILRVQLTRLDGILADLRRVKRAITEAVADLPMLRVNPSNDLDGDCGVCLPFIFDDAVTAEKFEKLIGGTRPINTGKHVYREWTPILEKRGAHISAMNPYENPANAGLRLDTREDSCPRTLDILSRTVYQMLNCDWTDAELAEVIEKIRQAAKAL